MGWVWDEKLPFLLKPVEKLLNMARFDLWQLLARVIKRENSGCSDARQEVGFLAAKWLTRYISIIFGHFYGLLSMSII